MKNIVNIGVVAMTMVLLSACSTLDVWTYKASSLSGTAPGKTAVIYSFGNGPPTGRALDVDFLGKDTQLRSAVNTQCKLFPAPVTAAPPVAAPPLAPALIPIAAALVQLGVEMLIDKKRRDVDSITESANVVYVVNTLLPPSGSNGLADLRCVVVSRYTEDEKDVRVEQMTVVLQVTHVDAGTTATTKALMLKPIFVRSKTAVATTRDDVPPKVSFAFAVGVKAVAPEPNAPVARLVPTGEASVSAKGVVLGGEPACTKQDCKASEPLPYPTNRGMLSVAVSVSEQGSTGFDNKVVDAELAAIKGALGPAFGEAAKTKLSD